MTFRPTAGQGSPIPARKVLIVSPRFPPTNTPDLHRVRTSLPYYSKYGWDATILCATSATSDGVLDENLADTVPGSIRVERTPAWPEAACRRLGFGHFNYRCVYPLFRRGTKLLSEGAFDTIFFSTTAFPVFALGPIWKRRFGCRIVYDYQDPWYAGQSRVYDRSTAPGGMLKYKLSSAVGRALEPFAMRSADHVVSTSLGYVDALRESYAWLGADQFTVMPFGAPSADFELLSRRPVGQQVFDRSDGLVHLVSIGRGGPDMFPVLDQLFRQVASLRRADPEAWSRVRLHFAGTNYAPAELTFKVVEPIAERHGVADLVDERPQRIPYLEALQALKDSHGVLLVGSIFPDYTPSKLFSCALSGRPALALLNRASFANGIAPQYRNLRTLPFDAPEEPEFGTAVRDGLAWLHTLREEPSPEMVDPPGAYSADELARRQCLIFAAGFRNGP